MLTLRANRDCGAVRARRTWGGQEVHLRIVGVQRQLAYAPLARKCSVVRGARATLQAVKAVATETADDGREPTGNLRTALVASVVALVEVAMTLQHEVRLLVVDYVKEHLGAACSTLAGRVVSARREPGMVPEQHRVLGGVEFVIQEVHLGAADRARRSLVRGWSLRRSRVEDYSPPVAVGYVVSVEAGAVRDLNRRRVGTFVPILLRTHRRGGAVVVVVPVRRPRLAPKGAPRGIVDQIVLICTVRVAVIPGGEDAPRTTAELRPYKVTCLLVPAAARRDVSGTDQDRRTCRRRGFARVAHAVAIAVCLRRVVNVRAVVRGVRHAVVVRIGRRGAACVALVAHAIAVVVSLPWVIVVRAVVFYVAYAVCVTIAVGISGASCRSGAGFRVALVVDIWHTVAVGIGRGRRTIIALVAYAIAVVVSLPRVVNIRAVVFCVGYAVSVTITAGIGAPTTAGGEGHEVEDGVPPGPRVACRDVDGIRPSG